MAANIALLDFRLWAVTINALMSFFSTAFSMTNILSGAYLINKPFTSTTIVNSPYPCSFLMRAKMILSIAFTDLIPALDLVKK
jgi:hypothetical protein